MEADRNVAVLLAVRGAKGYETLHSLLAPELPREKSFEQLLEVPTKHFDIHEQLSLVIVEGHGPALLGRNWLQYFQLDWSSIKTVILESDGLRQLLQQHVDLFTDELGTITPFRAKLEVSSSATPKFKCSRPVPYAVKPLVEQELDRLEKAGVIERVDCSEWAAPIVTVLKRDGRVRICGNYKVTVNPVLDIDQYPLPRPEDLFATLAGGKYFTTLDLSCLQSDHVGRRVSKIPYDQHTLWSLSIH